jgi:hypothetical protein
MIDDPFEPVYSPQRVEFWLEHFEELETLALSPKSSAHIAEHLSHEWMLLQMRLKVCLCKEQHDTDSLTVDPACLHMPGGGGAFAKGPITALLVLADLKHAAEHLPPGWLATRQIWKQQLVDGLTAEHRIATWRKRVRAGDDYVEREPAFARSIAVRRMARYLGWQARARAA